MRPSLSIVLNPSPELLRDSTSPFGRGEAVVSSRSVMNDQLPALGVDDLSRERRRGFCVEADFDIPNPVDDVWRDFRSPICAERPSGSQVDPTRVFRALRSL